MKKNVGAIDKAVRILVAVVIVVLYVAHQISGLAAIILLLFAAVFVLTSMISFCPLYLPLDISTKKDSSKIEH